MMLSDEGRLEIMRRQKMQNPVDETPKAVMPETCSHRWQTNVVGGSRWIACDLCGAPLLSE